MSRRWHSNVWDVHLFNQYCINILWYMASTVIGHLKLDMTFEESRLLFISPYVHKLCVNNIITVGEVESHSWTSILLYKWSDEEVPSLAWPRGVMWWKAATTHIITCVSQIYCHVCSKSVFIPPVVFITRVIFMTRTIFMTRAIITICKSKTP